MQTVCLDAFGIRLPDHLFHAHEKCAYPVLDLTLKPLWE